MVDKGLRSSAKLEDSDGFNPYILFLILILLILSKNVLQMLETMSQKKPSPKKTKKRPVIKGVNILPIPEKKKKKREETTEEKGE